MRSFVAIVIMCVVGGCATTPERKLPVGDSERHEIAMVINQRTQERLELLIKVSPNNFIAFAGHTRYVLKRLWGDWKIQEWAIVTP
jgi:hypothetical protein